MPHLNHLCITIDLDASLAFYCEVVGFEVDLRTRVAGEWFDTLTHNRGAEIDVAQLTLGDFSLQLVQYLAAGGQRLALGHNQIGNPHLCIDVEDVDAKRRAIVAAGGLAPTPIVDIMGGGTRSFYIADPDGVPVEFLQRG